MPAVTPTCFSQPGFADLPGPRARPRRGGRKQPGQQARRLKGYVVIAVLQRCKDAPRAACRG